jgi:predicted DNA-binding protein (UPF0251 family)
MWNQNDQGEIDMSPRPVLDKIINTIPLYVYFVPHGVSEDKLEEVTLTIEELESLNLKDKQGLDQVDAAKKMGISRATFQRLLKSARKKLITALIEGKALKFEGGNYIPGKHIEPIKCLKGTYHYRISKEDIRNKEEEYKISKIKCQGCGKRLVEFK